MPVRSGGTVGDAASEVMIGCLDAFGSVRRPLLVGNASRRLAERLVAAGAVPVTWRRLASTDADPDAVRAWPEAGDYDAALVRLPNAREALDFALSAVASVLAPGAAIALFGANNEGIRSAARRLAVIADDIATLDTRLHARVMTGRRKPVIDGLKGRLADWRHMGEIAIDGQPRPWVSYPGVFAKGGLDAGTLLLLRHLPEMAPAVRVLDFAAGTGVIAAAVLERNEAARVDLLEADALAVEATRENVPNGQIFLAASLAGVGSRRYDLILSNPPIHDGVSESRVVLDRLIADAPRHLGPGGRLIIVVQRRVAVMPALESAFGNSAVLADDGRFTVASATLGGVPRR